MPGKKPDPFMVDEDNPSLDAKFWKNARPARKVMPPAFFKAMDGFKKAVEGKKRGRPPVAVPKVVLSLRLAADLVAGIRASGPGYNARVEKLLRKALTKGQL